MALFFLLMWTIFKVIIELVTILFLFLFFVVFLFVCLFLPFKPPGKLQEYQSEGLFPPPGDLPNPGIKLRSPTLQADSLPSELLGKLIYKL